ncbi:hypothetical protein RJ55_05166 [Drechmeria coniospora]|nr:hypothetical protein RJ55_05166 [Drechmeria coniospora]
MDSPDKKPDGRPFRAVSVGTCYAQTANDRFGNGASEAIRERERPAPTFNPLPADPSSDDWPDSDSDDSHAMFFDQKIYQLVPTMQRFRNNLTALSQLYNVGIPTCLLRRIAISRGVWTEKLTPAIGVAVLCRIPRPNVRVCASKRPKANDPSSSRRTACSST